MIAEVRKLLSIMDAELLCYNDLLNLARRKADLLSSRASIQDIERIVGEEAALVNEVLRRERDRLDVMIEVTTGLGLSPTVTVTELAKSLDGDNGRFLADLGVSVTNVLTELRKVNRLNDALIAQELALVDFSIESLTDGGTNGAGTYSDVMRTARPTNRGSAILDIRA